MKMELSEVEIYIMYALRDAIDLAPQNERFRFLQWLSFRFAELRMREEVK
jgi:hypothetical protein